MGENLLQSTLKMRRNKTCMAMTHALVNFILSPCNRRIQLKLRGRGKGKLDHEGKFNHTPWPRTNGGDN